MDVASKESWGEISHNSPQHKATKKWIICFVLRKSIISTFNASLNILCPDNTTLDEQGNCFESVCGGCGLIASRVWVVQRNRESLRNKECEISAWERASVVRHLTTAPLAIVGTITLHYMSFSRHFYPKRLTVDLTKQETFPPWSNVGLRALSQGPNSRSYVRILLWPHQGSNHRPCGSKSSGFTTPAFI